MAVIVIFEPDADIELMPAAVNVTSVPVLLVRVIGDDVPVNARSVFPAPVAAIVIIPSVPVPVVVSVMFDPSAN